LPNLSMERDVKNTDAFSPPLISALHLEWTKGMIDIQTRKKLL